MKKLHLIIILIAFYTQAQDNCNAYLLLEQDSIKYKACELMNKNRENYYQFDWRQIELYEEVLEIDSTYADAYREIAAPYVKAGNFLKWKENIDKAVKYDPKGYLFIRGSIRYKFFADYKGAIQDIEEMESKGYFIDYTSNGMYHLKIVKGLCFKALGDNDKALAIIEMQINSEDHFLGLYDYIHLGVLYLEKGELDKAIEIFKKQAKENDIAENRYYIALAYKEKKDFDNYTLNLEKAKELYLNQRKMYDPYNTLFDQIYLFEIEKEIQYFASE